MLALKRYPDLPLMSETTARLKIQKIIDESHVHADIIVNGCTVWSKERIISNLEQIITIGLLYNMEQEKNPHLSHYFYQFLTQVCGSMQHVDIHGWIHKYPTVEHLRSFFKRNEFGQRVFSYIPKRKSDCREIVRSIELKLFPFEHYMKTHPKPKKVPPHILKRPQK